MLNTAMDELNSSLGQWELFHLVHQVHAQTPATATATAKPFTAPLRCLSPAVPQNQYMQGMGWQGGCSCGMRGVCYACTGGAGMGMGMPQQQIIYQQPQYAQPPPQLPQYVQAPPPTVFSAPVDSSLPPGWRELR